MPEKLLGNLKKVQRKKIFLLESMTKLEDLTVPHKKHKLRPRYSVYSSDLLHSSAGIIQHKVYPGNYIYGSLGRGAGEWVSNEKYFLRPSPGPLPS
jgi:hypothetical protein